MENSASIDLYYEDHGSGRPVVLIHGYPFSGTAWERQVPALLGAGCRVITYDRRGFGKSSQPVTGYDYDTFAADLQQILAALDVRDVVLVGHSMGTGEVTRYLGAYGSELVSKAVFISPIPPFLLKTQDNPEGVDHTVFDKLMQAVAMDRYAFLTQFLSDFYNLDMTLGKSVSDEVVRAGWNVASGASPTATSACVPSWLTDFREDLRRIDVPLLVIQGDADRVLPFAATGKRIPGMIPGSRLVTLKDGSHGIPWTHADDINRELLNFLE
jgi:non-heme chloroperoxidase